MSSSGTTLDGAVVVITGASSGIGRAAAQAFARQRVRVVLAARDDKALQEVAAQCRACGGETLVVVTDMTLSDSVERLASAAADFGQGRIDVWVNNAGVGAVGAAWSVKRWPRVAFTVTDIATDMGRLLTATGTELEHVDIPVRPGAEVGI